MPIAHELRRAPARRHLPADAARPLASLRARQGDDGDYFAHEQIATWGPPPQTPNTPYYRTFETPVDDGHLYEFVVPMVPPTMNEPDHVRSYAERPAHGATAVAVSTLDICEPAMRIGEVDLYRHWGLTHFLLDGHHKLQAAAERGRDVQLLTLLSIDASLADEQAVRRIPAIRARHRQPR